MSYTAAILPDIKRLCYALVFGTKWYTVLQISY